MRLCPRFGECRHCTRSFNCHNNNSNNSNSTSSSNKRQHPYYCHWHQSRNYHHHNNSRRLHSVMLQSFFITLLLFITQIHAHNNNNNNNNNNQGYYPNIDGYKLSLTSNNNNNFHNHDDDDILMWNRGSSTTTSTISSSSHYMDNDDYIPFDHSFIRNHNNNDYGNKRDESIILKERRPWGQRKTNHENRQGEQQQQEQQEKDQLSWKKDILSKSFLPSSFMNKKHHSNIYNSNSRQTQIRKRLEKGRVTIDFGSYVHHDDTTLWQHWRKRLYNPRPRQQYTNHHDRHPLWKKYNDSVMKMIKGINNNNSTMISLGNDLNDELNNSTSTRSFRHRRGKKRQMDDVNDHSPQSRKQLSSSLLSSTNYKNTKIRVTVDPSAVGRLSVLFAFAISSFSSAFMGTLRLLAPLVVSRRILVFIGTLVSDWYAGRYFRQTYTRVEKLYLHYYEAPATFRAISRSTSQLLVYWTLAKIMGWLVGITHPPCHGEGRGLAFFCGLLWIGSVVGTGHAFSTAVELWGGPLRLQAVNHPTRTSVKTILRRPWHILQWLQNPEQWISLLAIPERRPFDPNPIAFPATWVPLRLLQMIAVAKVAATEPSDYSPWCPSSSISISKLMKQYLIQLTLCDEWCRVLIKERRLGLGIVIACVYGASMVSLIITCACMDARPTSLILLVPSLLALIVSTWLNLVIYLNRYTSSRTIRTPVITPINSL